MQDPIGVGELQLEKIFPEPIHNIWLSSFVNYGWGGGIAWLCLAFGSAVVSIRNYRRTRSEIPVVLLASLVGIVMCAMLHEGEHWRHMWLFFGLVWGLNVFCLGPLRSRRLRGRKLCLVRARWRLKGSAGPDPWFLRQNRQHASAPGWFRCVTLSRPARPCDAA